MIDVTRWSQIKVLFDRAVNLSGAQREEYLRKSCASDNELRQELDSLLATYDADTGFLDTPALAEAGDLIEAEIPDAHIGRQIGPYLIARRIGEGGMGVVYEAVRIDSQPQQRVAIKLVRRGMDCEYILRRFVKERQILASLAHPNIAKLLDGGITEDGSPYFVMEFIEGQLIDDYCRSHLLDTLRCMELVHQIGGALEHAHALHIIHRDIKPGNIMVDMQGTPKLLDFGIAKLIATENGEMSQRTITELRIITPDYASPEQIRGDAATEGSDVYALGVVLYELVSGNRASALAKAPAAQGLPRALQLIIRRAAHPDAARRYSSMREFTADLHNFLAGQSIAARPDSVFYRLSRSFRRYSNFAWAGSLVVVALVAAFLSWFVQTRTGFLSGPRRSVAVVDFQNITGAPSTAWFSTALSEMLNSEISAGEKLRTIPGDSVARMKSDLGLQPTGSYSPSMLRRIAADLHPDYVVAGSYLATGDRSDMLVRVDLRLQDVRTGESLLAWTDTGTPAELPAIATRAGARLRQALGVAATPTPSPLKFANPESARLYAEGLERIRSCDPLGARARLERAVAENASDPLSHAALATALAQLGYEDRAADEAKQAMDRASGLSSQQRLEVQARYYTMRRNWSEAAATYKKLWADFPDDLDYGIEMANVQSGGGDVPAARQTIAQLRRSRAGSLDPRIDLAEARAAEIAGEPRQELEAAQRASSKARQEGATQALAESLYYEGWARWLLGDLKDAEQVYSEALELFAEAGNQRRVVDIKSGIATVLLDQGKATQSAQILEEGLAIARKLGNRSLEAVVNNNLARCWEELGQLKKAQAAYQETAAIDEELNDRPHLAVARLNLGGVLKSEGQFGLGEDQIREALNIARAMGKKSTIAMALSTLGEEQQALGKLSEAAQLQGQALTAAREIGRRTTIASALSGQAAILHSQGKWRGAETKYEEASRVAADAGAPAKLAEIRIERAQLLADEGRLEAGAQLAGDALKEFQKENNGQGQALAEATLVQIAARKGDAAEAQRLAIPARQHLAAGEVLLTRLQVTAAEAFVAIAMRKRDQALHILRHLLAEANSQALQETAWDVELLIGEIEPTASAKKRVQEIKREATARGILRIAQLEPRFPAATDSSLAQIHQSN